MELPAFLLNISPELAYGAFFVFLLMYSFSLPITEEIALILVGIVAQGRGMPFFPVFLVSYPGIFGSDLGYYFLAYVFGNRLLKSKIASKLINPRKVEACERLFAHSGSRITFFCRFLVGIRAPTMIAAGILRMDFPTYFRNDGLAALATTTGWLALGYYFGALLQNGLHSLVSALSVCSIIFILLGGFFAMRLINAEERRMDTHGI